MDKIEFREDKITFSYKKSYGECLYQDLIAVEYSKPYCILQIGGRNSILFLTYIIHSGFISGYQNRYGDNLKPPTNVYHRMTA
jgi:hypothetical protein